MTKAPRSLLALALVALSQGCARRLPIAYCLTGSLTYDVHALDQKGEPLQPQPLQREFEVRLDEAAWRIRVVPVGNTNFDSFIYSYDGTNLLHYFLRAKGRRDQVPLQSVTVEESPVPATATSAAGEYVWLALASGQYFKAQTNGTALSLEQLRSRTGLVKRYRQPCRALLSPAPPYLPIEVDYTQTNTWATLQDDGTPAFGPPPDAFGEAGYVGAQFRASGFRRVNGLTFPTEFEYRKFALNRDARTSSDRSCSVTVRANVKTISTLGEKVDCALPGKDWMIWDLREHGRPALYPVHDGLIPARGNTGAAIGREGANE
jgi:hypothetical protein